MWWYMLKDNIPQQGINDEQILEAVRSGLVEPSTLIATDRSPEWHPAESYPMLSGVFKSKQTVSGSPVGNPYTGEVFSRAREEVQEKVPAEEKAVEINAVGYEEFYTGDDACRCPHCWRTFSRENVLYISQHPSLFGDTMLPDEQQRFLPAKFTSSGQAVDAGGMICADMACPHCHLRLAATSVELKNFFFSIVGAPASGKSYFLTSMVHRLKERMSGIFDVDFNDADPLGNSIITGFENRLFMNSNPDELTSLEKTQLSGDMYNVIYIAGRQVNLPKPFIFKMHAQWPTADGARDWNVIFYDNAGEHFQPGADNFSNPGSRHLVNSDGIIFLFDPTADMRFRKRIPDDNGVIKSSKVQNQLSLLDETFARLRRYQSVSVNGKYTKPFIVSVSKFDTWTDLSPLDLKSMEPQAFDPESNMAGCNAYLMENISYYTREILLKYVPEFVAAVEAGAEDVIYLPNSSLGCCPERDPFTGAWGVRPGNIDPVWVEAPVLWLLMKAGLINEFRKMPDEKTLRIENFSLNDDYVIFTDPVRKKRIRLPRSWAGRLISMHAEGYRFIIPGADDSSAQAEQTTVTENTGNGSVVV